MAIIAVYADWDGLPTPLPLGVLHAQRGTGREIFEFEFDAAALAHPAMINLQLDPRLGLFEGRQHPQQGHETFGVFADASPDRWGRLLMRRRLERVWRLSEAYDINPVPESHGLKLNISEADNAMDLDLVRSVALYFRVDAKTANKSIERSGAIVKQWPKIATNLGVPAREQQRMAAAFQLAA